MSTQLIPAWLYLEQIVRTGKPERGVNQEESGAEFFAQSVNMLVNTDLGDPFTIREISG